MYDLADPDPAAPGVDVFEWPSGHGAWTSAISDEGKRVLFTTASGTVLLYDTSMLLESQSPMREELLKPIGKSDLRRQLFGAALSPDCTRIFVMAVGGILVLNALDTDLAQLRMLHFVTAENSNISITNACVCVGGLLAGFAGGNTVKGTDAKSRRVRVWRVHDNSEIELRTLELAAPADSVAITKDGGRIAVGTRDGVVNIISTGSWATEVMLGVASAVSTANMILSLAFSNNGAMLVAGRQTNEFVVYDCKTSAQINAFEHEGSMGYASRFVADDSDILFTGGGAAGSHTLHATKPFQPFCVCSMTPTESDGAPPPISNSAVSAQGMIALASGSRLQIYEELGAEMVVNTDLRAEISLRYGHKCALLWRPDGNQMACAVGSVDFAVFTVDGQMVFEKANRSRMYSMAFSPDNKRNKQFVATGGF
eukprot:SAG22_NODE_1317_length_4765_cov_2.131590_6_plen_425_part_01